MTISLPKELKKYVEQSIQNGHFSSASEFFRELIRHRKTEEDRLVSEIKASERDIRAGRFRRLTKQSLRAMRNT